MIGEFKSHILSLPAATLESACRQSIIVSLLVEEFTVLSSGG